MDLGQGLGHDRDGLGSFPAGNPNGSKRFPISIPAKRNCRGPGIAAQQTLPGKRGAGAGEPDRSKSLTFFPGPTAETDFAIKKGWHAKKGVGEKDFIVRLPKEITSPGMNPECFIKGFGKMICPFRPTPKMGRSPLKEIHIPNKGVENTTESISLVFLIQS